MIPYYQWSTIHLGPITIQVWGLLVALGMGLSLLILWKRAKKYNFDPEQLLDISIYLIILGLIFARVFHIIFYEPEFYFYNPWEILKVWRGGLSSFGGFFGAVLGFFLFIKRKKVAKKSLLSIADQICFAGIYGWIIARVGCSFIHDHLGKLSDGFLAVDFPGGSRLDMAIIEIIFLIPLAVVFFLLGNKKLFNGFYLSIFLVYYGILRFILDFWRATDIVHADVRYLSLTPGQYFGIVVTLIGIFLIWKKKLKK